MEISDEEKAKTQQAESDSLLAALKYRDRAKERRIKYSTPEPPSPTFGSSSASKRPKNRDIDDEDAVKYYHDNYAYKHALSTDDPNTIDLLKKALSFYKSKHFAKFRKMIQLF